MYLDSLSRPISSLVNPDPKLVEAMKAHFLHLNDTLEAKAKEMEYINDQSRLKEKVLKDKIEKRLQAGLVAISTPARVTTPSPPLTFSQLQFRGLPTPSDPSRPCSVVNATAAAPSPTALRNLQPLPAAVVQPGLPTDPSNSNFSTAPASGFNNLETEFPFSSPEFGLGTPELANFPWGPLAEAVSTPGQPWDDMEVGDWIQEVETARK